jgi:hypothetical protein
LFIGAIGLRASGSQENLGPGLRRDERIVGAALALGIALAAGPAAAKERLFSYDPITPVTRTLAEGGFSFVFEDGMFSGQKVKRLLSSQAAAEATLRPASERVLGASLQSLAGARVDEHDLYEILPDKEGTPLIRATCPGSDKAWLAFGELKRLEDLRVQAFGRYADGGKVHHCATLDFSWRGEWKLPERQGSRRPDLGKSPVPR